MSPLSGTRDTTTIFAPSIFRDISASCIWKKVQVFTSKLDIHQGRSRWVRQRRAARRTPNQEPRRHSSTWIYSWINQVPSSAWPPSPCRALWHWTLLSWQAQKCRQEEEAPCSGCAVETAGAAESKAWRSGFELGQVCSNKFNQVYESCKNPCRICSNGRLNNLRQKLGINLTMKI